MFETGLNSNECLPLSKYVDENLLKNTIDCIIIKITYRLQYFIKGETYGSFKIHSLGS